MKENDIQDTLCPLCHTPVSDFIACYGVPQRQCPKCRSVERQRVFWRLYSKGVFGAGLLDGKRVLHISPSIPERYMFKHLVRASVTTVDIRESCRPDLVADISSMPGVKDSSFDLVFISYVFTCTKLLQKAIAEISRVLAPGGVLLSYDVLKEGLTEEYSDLAYITQHYGLENFEKLGIGTFRAFGVDDYRDFFSPFFSTALHMENDIPTDRATYWLKGVKL